MALSTGMLRQRAYLVRAIARLRGKGFMAERVEVAEGALLGHRDDGNGQSMTPEAVAVAAEAVDEAIVRLWHPTYGLADLIVVWQDETLDVEQSNAVAGVIDDWLCNSNRAADLIEAALDEAVMP